MAHIIQWPYKTGVALLVYLHEHGVGKSMLADCANYNTAGDMNDLFIQWPYKTGIALLVYLHEHGVGKSMLANCANYTTAGDMNDLLSHFNSNLENKVLTLIDEVGSHGSIWRNEAKLKKLITQPEYQVELKGALMILIIISLQQIARLQLRLRELTGAIVSYNVAPNIATKSQITLGLFLTK